MKVAVVGAGLFGSLAAVELARAGARVYLYDTHPDIMWGASRANQGRLHLGYHYPRSPATASACAAGAAEFEARFPDAVNRANIHNYCVAAYGKTTRDGYRDFLAAQNLPYHSVQSPLTHRGSVELTVSVPEAFIDLPELRRLIRAELGQSGVRRRLKTVFWDTAGYDLVVDATYGRMGNRTLRFEVVEIALIRLGEHYRGRSFVVMDGDYISLDPLADLHMLYDVKHSVHASNVGTTPAVPEHLLALLDRGVVPTEHTRLDEMCQTARRFLLHFGLPTYVGSMFTVRAVLPDVDATDARPTVVERDGNMITVLGGKLDTAVAAARTVASMALEKVPV